MNIKRIALMLVVLLSVGMVNASFAEEAVVPETIVMEEQASEPVAIAEAPVETTPAETQAAVVPDITPDATEEAQPTQEPAVTDATATTEATAQPDETATVEPATAEPAAEETAAATEAAPIVRSVQIDMKVPENLQMGDTVVLSATLIGFDGLDVAVQWQYTKDGDNWTDAQGEGSTSLEYAFQVSDETAGTAWRLAVTVL